MKNRFGTVLMALGVALAWAAPGLAAPVAPRLEPLAPAPMALLVSGSTSVTKPYLGTAMLTPTFSGGTGVIKDELNATTVASPTSGSNYTTAALTANKTYTLTVTNAAGDAVSASVTVTVTPASISAVSPAAPTRTVSTATTFSATVSGAADSSITWSASGGTMNASTGAWTAPATPGSYTVTATSNADNTKTASTTVTVVAAPVIGTFSAAPTSIASGASSTLSWTTSGATSTSINQGIGSVSPVAGGSVSTGALTITKTYTLTATNAAGTSVTATATVTVAAAPTGTFGGGSITGGCSGTLSWTSSNATSASIDQGIGSVSPASGGSISVSPASTTTYTITFNGPGGTQTYSTTVTVTPLAISSFTSNKATITAGGSATLSATFMGGSGVITPGNLAISSGGSVTVSPATTTTYTLTVTSPCSTTTTSNVTITVVAAPIINAFSSSSFQNILTTDPSSYKDADGTPANHVLGTFHYDVSNADTITITNGTARGTYTQSGIGGSLAQDSLLFLRSTDLADPGSTQTVTLTVANAAGDTVSQSLSVAVPSTAPSISANGFQSYAGGVTDPSGNVTYVFEPFIGANAMMVPEWGNAYFAHADTDRVLYRASASNAVMYVFTSPQGTANWMYMNGTQFSHVSGFPYGPSGFIWNSISGHMVGYNSSSNIIPAWPIVTASSWDLYEIVNASGGTAPSGYLLPPGGATEATALQTYNPLSLSGTWQVTFKGNGLKVTVTSSR